MRPDVVLDCRGRLCPLPVIDLARAVGELSGSSGSEAREAVIAIEADDLAAAHDIPAWCRMRNADYLGAESADDGTPRYLVRVTVTG